MRCRNCHTQADGHGPCVSEAAMLPGRVPPPAAPGEFYQALRHGEYAPYVLAGRFGGAVAGAHNSQFRPVSGRNLATGGGACDPRFSAPSGGCLVCPSFSGGVLLFRHRLGRVLQQPGKSPNGCPQEVTAAEVGPDEGPEVLSCSVDCLHL